jgi:threonine dehydratase
VIRRTPIIAGVGPLAGVGFKLENLQRTGSFKLRGAVRGVAALDGAARARGVVAASAGNHGAGLALAGRAAGVAVTVVVPATTPAVKRAQIAALGAEVLERGAGYDAAEVAARALADERGAVFVSPFDDEAVIAGNGGDLGRELVDQVPDLARVVAPVGGGGLLGGLCAELGPRGVEVIGVQPAQNAAMHGSLAAGRALTVFDGGPTLAEGCDGAVAERTYRLVAGHGGAVAVIDEAAIGPAMAWAYRRLGQIVEPTGAVALAGLLTGVVTAAATGATVCILSGGNAEPDLVDEMLRRHPT